MIDDLSTLMRERGIEPRGIVHVGAHRGQEVPIYRAAGFERIVLVEPEPRLAAKLRSKFPDCEVIEAAVASRRARARKFNVASQRRWSSLIDVPRDQSNNGTIETVARIDVQVVRLSDIQGDCNVAVIDTQGTEPDVAASAELDALGLVIVETVQPSDVDRPAWRRDQADAWFAARGWEIAAEWTHSAPDVRDVAYARARR